MNDTPSTTDRFGIRHILIMVAGAAIGLSIWARGEGGAASPAALALGVFGGIALAGPPILLMGRSRRKRPWGAGRLLWFTQGTAAWLLWPPTAVSRYRGTSGMGGPTTAMCFAYGTPLMALFMVLSLTAGGWIRPRRNRRRNRRPLDWKDRLGLVVGLGWACVGLYLLAMFWYEDIRR